MSHVHKSVVFAESNVRDTSVVKTDLKGQAYNEMDLTDFHAHFVGQFTHKSLLR